MTREKAINIFMHGFPFNPFKIEDINSACGLAIAALRAQQAPLDRSRWEGCPACRDGEVIAWDLCNDGIVIESDGKVHMLSGGDWEVEINYCPVCGRPLTEEAWTELERKTKGV